MYCLVYMSSPQCGPSEHIHDSFKDLLSGIAMPNATYVLKIADRLYLEKTYPVLPVSCGTTFSKIPPREAPPIVICWLLMKRLLLATRGIGSGPRNSPNLSVAFWGRPGNGIMAKYVPMLQQLQEVIHIAVYSLKMPFNEKCNLQGRNLEYVMWKNKDQNCQKYFSNFFQSQI